MMKRTFAARSLALGFLIVGISSCADNNSNGVAIDKQRDTTTAAKAMGAVSCEGYTPVYADGKVCISVSNNKLLPTERIGVDDATNRIACHLSDDYTQGSTQLGQKNSRYVDFDMGTLGGYYAELVEAQSNSSEAAPQKLRIYFANYDNGDASIKGKMSAVLVAVDANGKEIHPKANDDEARKPVNLGTLCPPSSCASENDADKAFYLYTAFDKLKRGYRCTKTN